MKYIKGKIVDVVAEVIFNGELCIDKGKIISIKKTKEEFSEYILPGFIDSHIHIESSMLIPSEFAKMAVRHGTVATVSDPHEIANVMGKAGVDFMIKDGKKTPFKFFFGAPSCVPATPYETSGATLAFNEVKKLLDRKDIFFLAEMMNFPGVLYGDIDIWKKINYANNIKKPIDGHAPNLTIEDLKKYADAKISTDHESTTLDEAIKKIELGIKLQIREGSAAKNFTSLYKAIEMYPNDVMLCTDDLHPDNLASGHINKLIKRGLNYDVSFFKILRAATYNPIKHYKLNVGLLQKGDPADFIIVNDLKSLKVKKTFIDGTLVYNNGTVLINTKNDVSLNNFNCNKISIDDIKVKALHKKINVIEAYNGELFTKKIECKAKIKDGFVVSDIKNDILKIVVLNRYSKKVKPAVGFISNFNLKKGAIASTIAHDSHNIIAVGTSDAEIVSAINTLIDAKGGIVAVNNEEIDILKLNIAGIMTDQKGEIVAEKYKQLNKIAKKLGAKFNAPFMTLAFMALLVIPEIKIGDKGLFDVSLFQPISIFPE